MNWPRSGDSCSCARIQSCAVALLKELMSPIWMSPILLEGLPMLWRRKSRKRWSEMVLVLGGLSSTVGSSIGLQCYLKFDRMASKMESGGVRARGVSQPEPNTPDIDEWFGGECELKSVRLL